ncbi:MAG: cytochrome C, partial [Anaerolineae bacterium]|nr:cytochrome C [Anaerolineae bacterium]
MKDFKYIWVIGLIVTVLLVAAPIVIFSPKEDAPSDDPWSYVPEEAGSTNHTSLIQGPFESPNEVTETCLTCHPDAAEQVMATSHWTWLSDTVEVDWRDEPVATGKANLINNFCIGVQSNWTGCTKCHAGYGWNDASFDFSDETAVDCLACHDQSGAYVKGPAGVP